MKWSFHGASPTSKKPKMPRDAAEPVMESVFSHLPNSTQGTGEAKSGCGREDGAIDIIPQARRMGGFSYALKPHA